MEKTYRFPTHFKRFCEAHGCDDCPAGPCTYSHRDRPDEIEEIIMAWVAENPEPKPVAWTEWWLGMFPNMKTAPCPVVYGLDVPCWSLECASCRETTPVPDDMVKAFKSVPRPMRREKMKDRYLFRGKRCNRNDNHEGGWVYGSYIGGGAIIEDDATNYYVHDCANGKLETIGAWLVDPVTIGQCTGLKDKKGTLIYEGDIVRCSTLLKSDLHIAEGQVEYLPTMYCINTGYLKPLLKGHRDNTSYEILGNIHDNPEMLMTSNEQT